MSSLKRMATLTPWAPPWAPTSSLDQPTAEQFAKTVNKLKGKVTMIFIAHQLPKGLHVDSVITLGPHETCMQVVGGEREDG